MGRRDARRESAGRLFDRAKNSKDQLEWERSWNPFSEGKDLCVALACRRQSRSGGRSSVPLRGRRQRCPRAHRPWQRLGTACEEGRPPPRPWTALGPRPARTSSGPKGAEPRRPGARGSWPSCSMTACKERAKPSADRSGQRARRRTDLRFENPQQSDEPFLSGL